MRKRLLILLATLICMVVVRPARATDSPELQRYIDEARVFGMGEGARMTLRTVASVTTGGSIVTFAKVPGSDEYSQRYQSTSCPPRSADSLALLEWKKEFNARIDPEVEALRAIADTDSSGFVSGPEASSCRELIESGYFIAFLRAQGTVADSEIAKAVHVDEAALSARIEKYNDAAVRLNGRRHGPLEPRLPLVTLSQ